MDNNYTLKEVIEQRFDEMGVHLTDIKAQVTKTNGRVNSLEKSRVQIWTAITVSVFLGGGIFYMALEAMVAKSVSEAVTYYEIKK